MPAVPRQFGLRRYITRVADGLQGVLKAAEFDTQRATLNQALKHIQYVEDLLNASEVDRMKGMHDTALKKLEIARKMKRETMSLAKQKQANRNQT